MNNFEPEKRKKFLFLSAIIIVLIIAVFAILKNKKPAVEPIVSQPPEEKSMSELIDDLTASIDEQKLKPIPAEDINSLTASIDEQKLKPIPAEDIESLTAPVTN